jgi:predicted metal-dependent phosphotriesterase family hydrolase
MKVIRTVRGDIRPEELGITAPHEHLWCDQKQYRGTGKGSFPGITEKMYMHDADLVEKELSLFHAAGGRAIAEMTTDGWGRDVRVLKSLSEKSGVHVIAISGFYVEDCLQDYFDEHEIDELADILVREITEGAEGSDIHTGLLKSAVSRRWIEGREEKGARAVARAQKRTGVAITTHTSASVRFEIEGGNIGMQHLDLFEEEGVDLRRVIVGHTDENADVRQLLNVLERGAYVQFDTIGKTHWLLDETRIALLRQLVDAGYEDRIMLSTDRCRVSETRTHGGPGYAHVLTSFVPRLRQEGFTEKTIHSLLVDNPASIFSFEQV